MADPFAKCALVLVNWLDSHADNGGWTLVEDREREDMTFQPMRSVGWLMRENKEYLELAQNIGAGRNDASPQCCNIMTIPKRCIISKRRLTAG